MAAILEPDVLARDSIREALGESAIIVSSFDELAGLIRDDLALDTIILGPSVENDMALSFAEKLRESHPTLGVLAVRRRVDASILALASRSGIREVIPERDYQVLLDAVQRSSRLTHALRNPGQHQGIADRAKHGRLITVFSPKGGAGKTTLAVNSAVVLASRGLRVLLVDMDLAFGDVPISLGLRPEHDFQDVVNLGDRIDAAALRKLVTVHESGLHVLAAPPDPGVAEHVTSGLARRLLQVATAEYDYVIVDTPPSLDEVTISTMEMSDPVLMVSTLDIPSLKNVKVALETFRLVNFPMERVRVVLNRADSKVGLDAGEVARTIGVPVVASIPSSRSVPASTNRGVALVTDQPGQPVSVAINHLVSQEIVGEGPVATRRSGFRVMRRRAS